MTRRIIWPPRRPHHMYREDGSSYAVIRTIEDSFSLRHTRNSALRQPRLYDLDSVGRVLNDARTRELIRRGIAFGYISHDFRDEMQELTGCTLVRSMTARIADGRLTITPYIPACRTVEIELVGSTIRHVQQILNTEPGRLVDALRRRGEGEWGWSWSVRGEPDGVHENGQRVVAFEGIDFVNPPYFSSERVRAAAPDDFLIIA